MTARLAVSHLLVALMAFALGWIVTSGSPGENAPGSAATAAADPVAALSAILRIDDPQERTGALLAFFEETDPQWAPRLRDEVLGIRPPDSHMDEITEILFASWWAQSDPEAAFGNILHPPWVNRHPWVRTVIEEWVREDPAAAVAAVQSLPETTTAGRIEGARFALDGWLEQGDLDPAPLFGLVSLLEVKARGLAIERILNSMIEKRGIDETERWVESVPRDPNDMGVSIAQELMARMGVALLDYDVARAVAWAEEHGQGRQNIGVVKHLAFYWAARDGASAMEWVIDLPESPEKRSVVKRAWASFSKSDHAAARDWIEAQDPDPRLARVYGRYLRLLARKEPDRALALANKVSDPAVREDMIVSVGRGWILSDAEAVEAWMAREGLSSASQALIRSAKQAGQRPGVRNTSPSS